MCDRNRPCRRGRVKRQGAADVQFKRFGPHAHDQGLADQARGHRIGVVEHANGAEAGNRDRQLATEMQRGGGQRVQRVQLGCPAQLAGLVALAGQLLEQGHVAGAVGKVAAAPRPERLVDGLLEAVVGLLDIAVLMGLAGVVGRRGHAVVGHQGQVAVVQWRWPSGSSGRTAAERLSVRWFSGTPPTCQRQHSSPSARVSKLSVKQRATASTLE